jgi:hypothetical protein
MSDKTIFVPFEGEARDRAVLLLEAAEKKDLPASSVQTTLGGFLVPEEVEQEAFGGEFAKRQADKEAAWEKEIEDARDTELESQPVTREDTEQANREADRQADNDDQAKKAPAKKAAAKKATSRKED